MTTPLNNANIQTAVNEWLTDSSTATTTYGDITQWDTSVITNMTELFKDATTFNEDISAWNVSNVTNLTRMFENASNFNQNIGVWDVSNVPLANMADVLKNASSFNTNYLKKHASYPGWGLKDGSNNYPDLYAISQGAIQYEPLPGDWNPTSNNIPRLDIENLTNDYINQYGPIKWWDVSKVYNMNYFLRKWTENTNLTIEPNIDISEWDVSYVKDMGHALRQYPFNGDISQWDVSAVRTMQYMFYNNSSFNNNIGNWNTSSVTSMSGMFRNTDSFNQNIGNWNVSNCVYVYEMFRGAAAFNNNIGTWNTSNFANMQYMFESAINFNQDIGQWNVSNVTNMRYMFESAVNFNQDIGQWNVSSVTDMRNMFENASNFNQNIGPWDRSGVTDDARFDKMFKDATSFNFPYIAKHTSYAKWDSVALYTSTSLGTAEQNYIDSKINNRDELILAINSWSNDNRNVQVYEKYGPIEWWDISNVTDTSEVFQGNTTFNADIYEWDTSNITNMRRMFNGAVSFNQGIGGWNVSSVINFEGMFNNTTYDVSRLSSWGADFTDSSSSSQPESDSQPGSGSQPGSQPLSAGAIGDPYITTLQGFRYKMPNSMGYYRMLQGDGVIINASISPLTNEEKKNILFYCEQAVTNGFYFDEFFISYRNTRLRYDRYLNILQESMGCEYIGGKPCVEITSNMEPILHDNGFLGVSERIWIDIKIRTETNEYKIKLSLYKNPQILNGIEISVFSTENIIGVLNDYVHPKNYRIKSMTNTKKVERKIKKQYTKIAKEFLVK